MIYYSSSQCYNRTKLLARLSSSRWMHLILELEFQTHSINKLNSTLQNSTPFVQARFGNESGYACLQPSQARTTKLDLARLHPQLQEVQELKAQLHSTFLHIRCWNSHMHKYLLICNIESIFSQLKAQIYGTSEITQCQVT